MSPPATVTSRLTVFDWLNRVLVVLIVLAVLGAIGVNYLPLIRQDQTLREKLERSKEEVAKLDADLKKIVDEIQSLTTDPRHVERKVREIGYAKPDELVVTFRDAKGEPSRR
jgi:cell division protein FtsB